MSRTKPILVFFIFLLLFSWFTSSGIWKRINANNSIYTEKKYHAENAEVEKLKKKSSEATSFIKKNGYNESICFFVDMTLPSGQNRFFVYNVAKDSIQDQGWLLMAAAMKCGWKEENIPMNLVADAPLWANTKLATPIMEGSDLLISFMD
jgi:hypothetical protein